jgi:TatD family-associated radical SAM protein
MNDQTIAYSIADRRYLSITDRCTLACKFCPKTQGSMRVHEYDLTFNHRPETDEIIAAIGDMSKYSYIVFCGFGEPTLRLKTLLEVSDYIKQQGGRVRLNTDGLANLVHKRNVIPEIAECVDAVSVSLNAQNESIYNLHCAPALEHSWHAMLDFLELASVSFTDVTATAINGLAGVDIGACRFIAKQRGVKFRQRELDLVG